MSDCFMLFAQLINFSFAHSVGEREFPFQTSDRMEDVMQCDNPLILSQIELLGTQGIKVGEPQDLSEGKAPSEPFRWFKLVSVWFSELHISSSTVFLYKRALSKVIYLTAQ
eukprot:757768-Hanusia_phi.AAC.2